MTTGMAIATIGIGLLVIIGGSVMMLTRARRDYWNDKSERAHRQREERDWPGIAPYAAQVGGESFLRRVRRENFVKQAAEFPQVSEIVAVRIMPTGDGHATVSLIDVDGKECTFWLVGQLPVAHDDSGLPPNTSTAYSADEVIRPVRSITNY